MRTPLSLSPCKALTVFSSLLLAALVPAAAGAAEVSSNGSGGGRWSDPLSWHGGAVPSVADKVVVGGADVIHFDGGRQDAPNCAGLAIDPGGVLDFATGPGVTNHLLVDGPVTAHGTLRVDATRDPTCRIGLVLVGADNETRTITLLRGGAMLLYGAEMDGGTYNIMIAAGPPQDRSGGLITADGGVMLDLQRIEIAAFRIAANRLDNTGYKANQRLNLIGCLFTGGSSVRLTYCDTAAIRDNRFTAPLHATRDTAVDLVYNSLTTCRGNRIEGYYQGFDLTRETDVSILDNHIIDTRTAIISRYGGNSMIRGNTVSNVLNGVVMESNSGIIEKLLVGNATSYGVSLSDSAMQISDVITRDMPTNAVPLRLNSSAATMVNCSMTPADIRLEGAMRPEGYWVRCMSYLVIRLTGKVPPQSIVRVATAAVSGGVPKDGSADLNVRNSPVNVGPTGWTPLPGTMRALVVRAWQIGADKKPASPPFYDLEVAGFQADGAPDAKPRHKSVIEPAAGWFRPDPDAPVATLEVKLP